MSQYLPEFKAMAAARENDIMQSDRRKKSLGRIYPG